jgi:L-seryl-tRNA(Ser) seleniumtransferase
MSDFRIIPSIEQLRQRDTVRALERHYGREAIVQALREEVDELRKELARARGKEPGTGDQGPGTAAGGQAAADKEAASAAIEQRIADRLQRTISPSLRPLINATGVVVHTNLGRAPLALMAARHVLEIATGYSNLEYDVAEGRRGARDVHAERLLCRLTGAEAAVVVNNNAAATLLILAALAAGREVIVSRGELVEIGGGFRVPEIMAQSGALLREVGTTNKTRLGDYATAINDRTALILRVHRSNFRIEGFTEQPVLSALVALARDRGVPLVEDLGSGYLGLAGEPAGATLDQALQGEPKVQASVQCGVDLICFSGDKLLGGPQAGIIVGRAALAGRVRTHPLMRAVRADKMAYAALEGTLAEYAAGRAGTSVPVLRMISLSPEAIERRAVAVADRVRSQTSLRVEIIEGFSAVGGGAAPGLELPTRLLALSATGESADRLDARLRALRPPVIGRIEHDRLVLDVRTVLPDQDELLAELLAGL